ncbi:dUTP diphosphatase [Romboutsia sp.]|uniref:dUTP diphosphatase n=1 Tax=Romboutsia sp. TaxID=1965302 RepID=UPI002C68B6BD|nr:dUTP diphosphatase [Romboutsia sp.]HSQ90170.1 dUTP diphosphatase [Romboutsia sp.]
MKLTKEQLQTMMDLQGKMDELALKNNGVDEELDLTQEKYIALKTELHEFINEIEEFKFWKKNKGKDHVLEEGIDTIHFILSLMIDYGYEMKEDLVITKEQLEHMEDKSINELYVMTDALMVDTYMMRSWAEMLTSILIGILLMLNKCGFTGDNIYDEYIRKNKINIERQEKQY